MGADVTAYRSPDYFSIVSSDLDTYINSIKFTFVYAKCSTYRSSHKCPVLCTVMGSDLSANGGANKFAYLSSIGNSYK